jgi:hypothetical protein
MSTTKTRYVLRRADGAFFHQPDDLDLREWRSEVESAHRWVDIHAAAAAAYIWTNLKHEDVRVTPLTLTASQQHQALEYSA